MGKIKKLESSFEEALDRIILATWSRPRTNEELRNFVQRHRDSLVDVEVAS